MQINKKINSELSHMSLPNKFQKGITMQNHMFLIIYSIIYILIPLNILEDLFFDFDEIVNEWLL